VFSRIYRDGIWGERTGEQFTSGSGTHDAVAANTYVEAVNGFLETFGIPPAVVDLGCGDFAIGRQLCRSSGAYVACDVVPGLIEHHRDRFRDLDVDFLRVDLVADDLPEADVAIVRQVFQHLSNDQIAAVLPKLVAYDHVIVTEHVPATTFVPNADKVAGPDTRLDLRAPSGVVLTAPPFSWPVVAEDTLCEAVADGSVIRTIHYRPRRGR